MTEKESNEFARLLALEFRVGILEAHVPKPKGESIKAALEGLLKA